MTIALNGQTYRIVRHVDSRVVLIQVRRGLWRVAPARIAAWIVAGMRVEVVANRP